MKIQEAETKIKALVEGYLPEWEFEWDNATSRFGRCNYLLQKITLSKTLVKLNDWEQVKDTALHEIAHGLVGIGHHHDQVWEDKCIEIGCSPERCYPESVVRPSRKYVGICPNCGRKIYRNRRNEISCGKCSKVWNPKYKFIWKLNKKGV